MGRVGCDHYIIALEWSHMAYILIFYVCKYSVIEEKSNVLNRHFIDTIVVILLL